MTSVRTAAPVGPPRIAGRATGWWGMFWGLAALMSMHSTALFGYFYLGALNEQWPPPGIDPPGLLLPTVATVLALLSVVPAIWAHTSVRVEQGLRLQWGAVGVLVLGGAFIAVAGFDLATVPFRWDTHAYGSAYYLISGFHLLNGLAGLGIFVGAATQVWGVSLSPRLQMAAVNAALFWYWVAGGWLPVYATLHLSPYLW